MELVTLGRRFVATTFRMADEAPISPWVAKLFPVMRTAQGEEKLAGLTGPQGMREWGDDGPRPVTTPSEETVDIATREFADTVKFRERWWRRKQFGMFEQYLRRMSNAAATFPELVALDTIKGLKNQIVQDKQAYFDIDHPTKGGVQSNKITAAVCVDPSDPTPEEVAKAIKMATTSLFSLRDMAGKAFHRGNPPLLVMAPNAPRDAFEDALSARIITNSVGAAMDNTLATRTAAPDLETIVDLDSEFASGPVEFILWRTDGAEAAGVMLEEFGLIADSKGFETNSPSRFDHKEMFIGAQRAFDMSGVHYQYGVHCTLAAKP